MKKIDKLAVNAIRFLAADAIQKAKSGHPGMPVGAAPIAWTLWEKHMRHNPKNPGWDNRDRFILSAGHASMLEYALLHIFGYGLPMSEIRNFRQWESLTPGHPEHGLTAGVEATSGPLGQGIAMGVGFAMAEAHLAAVFNKPGYDIVDHCTYVLTGDGCLQEGVSAEACSLAGTLGLGKLILLYDRNGITIEGEIKDAFSEKVGNRYKSYGWQVIEVAEGNADVESISKALSEARAETGKPSLIIVNTEIAYGVPGKRGSAAAHGAPLGEDNIEAWRKQEKWNHSPFTIPTEVKDHMKERQKDFSAAEKEWKTLFAAYKKAWPEEAKRYAAWHEPVDEAIFDNDYWAAEGEAMATRQASSIVLNKLAARVPNLMGGSADLAPANNSVMKERGWFSKKTPEGTNLHFGIREFAMAAVSNGLALHGGVFPYCATFLVFTDYMKGAMRMAALMELPVIYVLTHDSIAVGEDGPTHEPIEHLATLRATPGIYTWRPADVRETAAAYKFALTAGRPSAIALSRQPVPLQKETGEGALRGGYVLRDGGEKPDLILIATGTEVDLALNAADALKRKKVQARVVSMPCVELFEEQDADWKEGVIPAGIRARVVVEAASSFGWAKYMGDGGDSVTIDHFGASAPAAVLQEKFGFTVENVVAKALGVIRK